MNTTPRQDKELLDAWRSGAGEMPSPALDAAILHAAQVELAERARAKGRARPWWLRWAVPVSVTAVAVIGLSLSLRVADEDEVRDARLRAGALPPAAPAVRPESPAAVADRAEPVEKPGPRRDAASSADARRTTGSSRRPVPQVEARSPAPTSAGRGEGSAAEVDSVQARPEAFRAGPGGAAGPDAAESPGAHASGKAAGAPAPPASAVAPAASAGASAAPRAAPVSPARQDAAVPAAAAPPMLKREAVSGPAEPATREAWIEELRALVRSGQQAQARVGVQRFKARYPGFPLPADLAGLADLEESN